MKAIDCTSAMRQLFDYLDGELTDARMKAVAAHVQECRSCYPHYDFEKLLLGTLRTLKEERAAPAELRRRVLDALRSESLGTSGG